MASTSKSSTRKRFKYDVFLSFRGEDTRKNFIDHLYFALEQKSIHTYKDDEIIKKGKTIGHELLKAIQDSKFYIIVFSKNYASSSWCLDELVQIMECQKMTDHTAYPVFYDVKPTEVRKQSGQVGKAFTRHEKEEAAEKWSKWRQALKEAACLTGWELKNTLDGHEAKFIQMIVEELSLELRFISSDVDEKLIGMETRINDVVSRLETSANDVRMIGIKGMGGSGKTTLARAVYDRISILFEGTSFAENVREVSKGSRFGYKTLQNQVLSDIFKGQGITVSSASDGKNMMKKMLCARKVLVVLDDIDHIDQLEALAGHSNWFKPGSRIIITTRDEQVLVAHQVNLIHNVKLLSDKEATCLFNRYAFGKDIQIQGYKELSEQVVCYAAGLPLTIKVLGSFLCGKDELEWKDAIERLKTIPLKETLEKLELSYNSLDDDYKEIFLDVACIFKWWNKDEAITALECCGFHARNGLRVLEQKSLITISEYGELGMHDHIEEMGKNIVRRLHPNKPNKHSRLWIDDEIKYILANDLGTEDTKCTSVYTNGYESFQVTMKGLTNMKELRFLDLYTAEVSLNTIRDFDKVNLYLPNSLRFLKWMGYPFAFLHSTFQNLVGLDMYHSYIDQLWDDGEQKVLSKLKFLSIHFSLLRTLDLRLAPNVETVSLVDSYLLEELHMPAESPKLISLHLENANLTTLHLGITKNLENLSLKFFDYLDELHMPAECLKLKSLELSHLKLSTIDLGITPNLETLSIRNCTEMVKLQIPAECPKLVNLQLHNLNLRTLHLGIAPNLRFLYLSYLNLRSLDFRLNPNLESLHLEECYLVEVNAPVGCLKKLVNLNICASKPMSCLINICGLQSLRKLELQGRSIQKAPDLTGLECLDELRFWSTDITHLPDSICMLKNLKFLGLKCNRYLEKLPDDLGQLVSLEELILHECVVLQDIPNSICEMKRLEFFYLSNCNLVETLPEEIGSLVSLKRLDIQGTSIRHLPQSIYRLEGLCISGSKEILESCGLTSEIQIYENETFCYI